MMDIAILKRIIDIEFQDIIAESGSDIYRGKIRTHIIDGSFIDIWLSTKIPGRFA